jgi:uncharacterized protein with PQ loop repeat
MTAQDFSEKLAVEIIGYSAAIVTNTSIYPQAYEVYIIVNTNEYEKLDTLSFTTFFLQLIGCVMWLIYGIITTTYPIIAGSILCIIPSGYIALNIVCYKEIHAHNENQQIISSPQNVITPIEDESEIIIASGSNWPITE